MTYVLKPGKKYPWQTHGHSSTDRRGIKSRTYQSWTGMKGRCLNKNHSAYKNYGGRGIMICERWCGDEGFNNFLIDMGERPDGLNLDRIDNNGNYTPENCRWTTVTEQNRNTRRRIELRVNGKTVHAKEFAKMMGVPYTTLWRKIKDGKYG